MGRPFAEIFLGETEVVSHFPERPPPDGPIHVTLELVRDNPRAFAELRRRTTKKRSSPGSLAFAADAYPLSHDASSAKDRKASFVLDYDEPPVRAAHARAVTVCGPSPTPDQLAVFVDRYIEHKDLQRPFDIASQVARRKEGDCTEHAVLLAALARSFGLPARVVMGIAIVAVEGKVEAVGHAWTEIYERGSWRLADAALPPELGARYLPMEVMGDEGPAFARHMLEKSDAIELVKRIVLDPVDGAM
jgi:hypothetical protein